MKIGSKQLMAYIFMPLIFTLIGYGIAALALSPFYEVARAAGSLVITDERPDFSGNLTSTFEGNTNVNLDIVNMSSTEIPIFGTHYAEITSDRIGLSASVFFGDSYEILRIGVGQYAGSFLPGFGGTILMAGHNTTHFLPLKDIEAGDILEIRTNYGHYQYEVTDTKVLHKSDGTAFDLSERAKEQLVLYTCYPFESIVGITQQRLFVYADKISGPSVMYSDELAGSQASEGDVNES